LWGKSILVAPIHEKGATKRTVYLPKSMWYDFWTGEHLEGGREITAAADLQTLPLFVRAGSILPLGPVKQYVDEQTKEPLSVSIYPGTDASFLLYEDDGSSFNYRKGEWMGIQMTWNDERKVLRLQHAPGSRMLPPTPRTILFRLANLSRNVTFTGTTVEVSFTQNPERQH
jgi:alpha-glucosidase (family GH31 glycosyl hydrolase)